uniref:Uncharacterized protein n=1 Tax=Anguilla anguilla TaxID=7936 RepID=A0A0E9VV64_ANGAN
MRQNHAEHPAMSFSHP